MSIKEKKEKEEQDKKYREANPSILEPWQMAKNACLNISEGLYESVTGKKVHKPKIENDLFVKWKEYLEVTWTHEPDAT